MRIALLLAVSTAFPAAAAEPARPFAAHPDNGHYFLFRGKPTVLVTSGEHYGAVLNLDFDYKAYLKALAADGLNHTRTFAGTYREVPGSFEITDNVLATAPGKYVCPWARGDAPGYFDGGNKFDLSKWDDAYFRRLKDFLAEAGKHGVVVELNLFCPNYDDKLWKANPMQAGNNVNGVGNCPKDEAYTLKHQDLLAVQEAFVRKVVAELKDFDNLYYEVCNEPYFGGVTMDWQHRIVDTIVDAEKDFPHKHLISLNVANGRAKVEKPHPAVGLFNFHYCHPP
ncbi:MAG: cellulase family glycosylhydrolase, partial [Gemmataceae bacterium]|nr:cellulase family glycosylhydrolase [Gemmataceae bacterium]